MSHPSKFALLAALLVAGCASQSSIKPAEVLDERTGITVGALQMPLEFVIDAQTTTLTNDKRASFSYLGPIEWDRMGDISYALWVHVAPGNDRPIDDIHAPGAVTLKLDDGPLVLEPLDSPAAGGPYKPVVPWGQTGYYALTVDTLKRIAGSRKITMNFRAPGPGPGDTTIDFLSSQDTHKALTQFTQARGITGD